MPGTIRLMLRQPVVKELLLAIIAFSGALIASSNGTIPIGKLPIILGFAAYSILLPNSVSLFGGQPDRRKKVKPANGESAVASMSLAEAAVKMGQPTNEKYVIIGGAGFVGERLMLALLARGETRVTCLNRTIYERSRKLFGSRVEFVEGNVNDPKMLANVLKDASVVFAPFAELCFFDWMPKHFNRYAKNNVTNMQILLDACSKSQINRLIFTGSCNSLFSEASNLSTYEDESPLTTAEDTISCYGLSKAIAEEMVMKANGMNGMATGIVRAFSVVFGFRDKNFFDRFLRLGSFFTMGDVPNEWIDVDDVVYAHLLLEKRLRNGPKDKAAGQAFNVASYEALTYSEFAKVLDRVSRQRGGKGFGCFSLPQRSLWPVVWFVDILAWALPFDVKKILGIDLGILTTSTFLTATCQPTCNDDRRNKKAREFLGYQNLMTLDKSIDRVLREYEANEILLQ